MGLGPERRARTVELIPGHFELVPSGAGTTIRLTETGFREQGWEIAVLEETYREHATSWDRFVPQLGEYVARLVSLP